MDVAVGEAALGAALVVDRREHVGLRPEVAHLEEHAVRAPHAHEEVVDQCRAQLGPPCRPTKAHGAAVYARRRVAATLRRHAPPGDTAAGRLPARPAGRRARPERRRRAVRRPLRPGGGAERLPGEEPSRHGRRRPRRRRPEPAAPADEQAVASQDTAAPTLPRTGLPATCSRARERLLLAAGTHAAPARVLTPAPVAINARAAVRREIGGVERWARELSSCFRSCGPSATRDPPPARSPTAPARPGSSSRCRSRRAGPSCSSPPRTSRRWPAAATSW